MAIPEQLAPIEPFIRILQALPDDELNEDIDTDLLHDLLRQHVAGMSARQADAEIAKIRQSIDTWMSTSADLNGPAVWLAAYLSYPRLGRELVQPPQPVDTAPQIFFDSPVGWTTNRVPYRLDLSLHKLLASITVVDQMTFDIIPRQNDQWVAPPHIQATRSKSDVSFGPCKGFKYVYMQAGKKNWKRVDYVLTVPGGFATVWIGTESGDDFDESAIEDQLHTLALTQVA